MRGWIHVVAGVALAGCVGGAEPLGQGRYGLEGSGSGSGDPSPIDIIQAMDDAGVDADAGEPEPTLSCADECDRACHGGPAYCDRGIWDRGGRTCTCAYECGGITASECQETCASIGCGTSSVEGVGDGRTCTCGDCGCNAGTCTFHCGTGGDSFFDAGIELVWYAEQNDCEEGYVCDYPTFGCTPLSRPVVTECKPR